MTHGADFSDIQPLNNQGQLDLTFRPILPATIGDLDNAVIQQVTPNNSFRLGQQVYFWLGLQNPMEEENFVTRVRLKLWWARPAREYRQPGGGNGQIGAAVFLPIDREVYGNGPVVGQPLEDNRYVWTPSPKRLDVTQFDTAPPPLPPARNSDSLMLDDCWTADLYDPSDATLAAKFPGNQAVTRWVPILYPAFGYALGFTAQLTFDSTPGDPPPRLFYNLTYAIGTFGGGARIAESAG